MTSREFLAFDRAIHRTARKLKISNDAMWEIIAEVAKANGIRTNVRFIEGENLWTA